MAPRGGYTVEGGSSITSMDLGHGSVESGESLQVMFAISSFITSPFRFFLFRFAKTRSSLYLQPEHRIVDEPSKDILDLEFYGIDMSSTHRCIHGMHPAKKVAFVYAATGRRFLGCPLSGDDMCHWFLWIDEPWGPVLSRSIKNLWDQTSRGADRAAMLETKKKEMEHAYFDLWTERSNMEIEHEQVVNGLKNKLVDNEIKMSRRLDFHIKLCVASISSAVTLASLLAYVLSTLT
uniref:Zinc finger GRF-type domain-containing protein n=1 Tax=Triticum urartu TaxID=4572 RepID=A0A8R7UKT1_TRIUA